MMNNIVSFAVILFTFVEPLFAINIEEYFRGNEIVPQIIPACPKSRCKVIYPNVTINMGVMYRRAYLMKEPQVTWECNPGALYAIIMTCLDDFKEDQMFVDEIHWWLVVNIRNCKISKGETVFNYAMINRSPMEGAHRVVLLVYKQPIYYNYEIISERPGDTKISLRRSVTIQELVDKLVWGEPVAGNAFRMAN